MYMASLGDEIVPYFNPDNQPTFVGTSYYTKHLKMANSGHRDIDLP